MFSISFQNGIQIQFLDTTENINKIEECLLDLTLHLHWRRQEFYYFDFGRGALIHFSAAASKFIIFHMQFYNFGDGTFPLFPHPGGACGLYSANIDPLYKEPWS